MRMAKPWHQQLIEAGVIQFKGFPCDGLCEPLCEACAADAEKQRAHAEEVGRRVAYFMDREDKAVAAIESGLRALSGNPPPTALS